MASMFYYSSPFNQDLRGWDVSKVTGIGSCDNMSDSASSWNDAYKPGQTSGHPCNGQ